MKYVSTRGAAPVLGFDDVLLTGLAAEREPAQAERLAAASTHWLRHTAASHQLEAGVPLLVVSQNLRHASIQTTRKYLHTEDDARHQASQAHGLGEI